MKGIRVIGSGLIGTSIALALSGKGYPVAMADSDGGRAALAQDLVGSVDISEVDLGGSCLINFSTFPSYIRAVFFIPKGGLYRCWQC